MRKDLKTCQKIFMQGNVPILNLNQQVESGHKADDKNTFLVKVLKDNKAAMGGGGDGLDTTYRMSQNSTRWNY